MENKRGIINTKKLDLMALIGVVGFSVWMGMQHPQNNSIINYESLLDVVPDTIKQNKLPDDILYRYLFGTIDIGRHFSEKSGSLSVGADVLKNSYHFAFARQVMLNDKGLVQKLTDFSQRVASYGEHPASLAYALYYVTENKDIQMNSTTSLDGKENTFHYGLSVYDPQNSQKIVDGFQFVSQASTGYPFKTQVLMFNKNIAAGPTQATREDLERISNEWGSDLPEPVTEYINQQLGK